MKKAGSKGRPGRSGRLADAACLLVSVIWGFGFIGSQLALDAGLGASAIMALRFGVAAVLLVLLCLPRLKLLDKGYIFHGVIAGLLLFCGFYLQIVGQGLTTVSNTSFLTATNVVMVPFIVWLVMKKAPPLKTFLLACLTLAGIGLLTLDLQNGLRLNVGDLLILACAAFFALHIFYLGVAVKGRDAMLVALVQIAAVAVVSAVVLVFDKQSLATADMAKGIWPALYLGVLSTCVCYILQTWAQKYTSQTRTGILLSCEGLFGALFSVLLGYEAPTVQMVVGGLVIFLSVVLMELPAKQKV